MYQMFAWILVSSILVVSFNLTLIDCLFCSTLMVKIFWDKSGDSFYVVAKGCFLEACKYLNLQKTPLCNPWHLLMFKALSMIKRNLEANPKGQNMQIILNQRPQNRHIESSAKHFELKNMENYKTRPTDIFSFEVTFLNIWWIHPLFKV